MARIVALTLTLVLLPVLPGHADDAPPFPAGQAGATKADQPSPLLVRLDESLTKAQDEKENGRLDEKHYKEFVRKFRGELEDVMAGLKATPPNTGLHARILSRLGDSEQAMASLVPAIKQDPESSELGVALSRVQYDRKDYPAAFAAANGVLERDPGNKEALALKHFSAGRISSGGAPPASVSLGASPIGVSDGTTAMTEQFRAPNAGDSPKVQALVSRIRDARESGDLRMAMSLTQELMRTEPSSEYTQEIYRIVAKDYGHRRRVQETVGYINNAKASLEAGRDDEALEWTHKAIQVDPDPKVLEFAGKVQKVVDSNRAETVSRSQRRNVPAPVGGIPLWPILPMFGIGAATYAVKRSRATVESEDGFNEYAIPRAGDLQRFVAGAVLAGIVGASIYTAGAYAIGAAAPLAARFMAGPGQYTENLSEADAVAINSGEPTATLARVSQSAPSAVQQASAGVPQTAVLEQQMAQDFSALRTIGQTGSSPRIRLVDGNVQEAQALFQRLSHFGKTLPESSYPGQLVELPNGARIGLRLTSTSGPPTIDVHNFPGFAQNLEIKFVR